MDKLSSIQRMIKFYRGEKIDRIPMLSCATMYAGKQYGLTSEEFYFDVKKSFDAQKKLYEQFGFDDVPCYDLPHGEVLDLGGELFIPKSKSVELPYMKKYVINSLEDAWSYTIPPLEQRKFTKYRIKFLKYAKEKGERSVSISAGSPFTIIGSMVETGLFMRWLQKEPDTIYHLLKIAIQYLNETADILIEKFGLENCSVSSNYPFESNNLISPKLFKKYAFPSMMEIHEIFRSKGLAKYGIHLCGNQNKNLEFFRELGLRNRSFISSDEQNNLKYVSEILGNDNIYGGNVSTKLLVHAKPQDVYKEATRIISEMKYNAGGFIIMPSCDLPINTKPENLLAILEAVRQNGKY